MSSQGSGTLGLSDDFTFRVFLVAWGDWARSESAGGKPRVSAQHVRDPESNLSWAFTDDEMSVVDSLIAKLPNAFKRIIKRVHLGRAQIYGRDETTYTQALRAFGELVKSAEEEGSIKIIYLD